MSRTLLLGAASAVALACISGGAIAAQSNIQGGGSTLAQFDYLAEFAIFNGGTPTAIFNQVDPRGGTIAYWGSGSGTGQLSFLNNDNTCNSTRVITGTATCAGSPGGAAVVDYGASDAVLSSTQVSGWSSSALGQSAAADLIQLPSFGTPIAIPVVNANVTSNTGTSKTGGIGLTDAQLCGIFSGKLTNWNQIGAAYTPGTINVVYRSDGSGTSFILTNHLSAVCTTGVSGNSNVAFTATTTFANVFPFVSGSTTVRAVPSNFTGESGSGGVANYMSNIGSSGVTSAIGYLSPDYTSIVTGGDAKLGNGQPSALFVAGVLGGNRYWLPTAANTKTALSHAATGSNLTAPTTKADIADPTKWIPLIQTTSGGYPIVGYTTFDFAQCYNDKNVSNSIVAFLKAHYKNTSYTAIQARNGFVTVANSGASTFITTIFNNILADKNAYHLNIGNPTTCATVVGRK